jgi:hypothetical protein
MKPKAKENVKSSLSMKQGLIWINRELIMLEVKRESNLLEKSL